jgi:class 3 adenylate cyclase
MAACRTCGFANDDAARFCGSCGASLTTTCSRCDAPLVPGLRFCTSCGEPVSPTPRAPVEGEVSGGPAERRRVSVLFVDLENFTPLAEHLDPEEVRGVQARYFEAARGVVASHGGTIEKFIGDAVMAVWGAPVAHEDDAERAVAAALGIVDAVSRLGGAASGTGLRARAAVTTGEAAVSIGTEGHGMVSGDLVNVASRLQSKAPSGGVLVDEATHELAPSAATYEATGSMTLKGRTGRLAAFRAAAPAAGARGAERGAHTGPFVGRDAELRELLALFAGVGDGVSRLVSVTGIAGIGKSRLAWELRERLDALPEDVAWHAGRAPAYGEGITFAAVAEMVRRRIRVADDASPTVARRQLALALEELVRDAAERRWMEPRVAVLLGSGDDHDFDRDELFAAWRKFFERVSDRSVAVLVFEDLQWADPALLDFVEHLSAWARDHRLLIVALARPELLDRRPGWGSGAGRFTSLHLERLSDAKMRELLLGRAPGLGDALVRTILERAGGVPLYAVEVARILADRAGDDRRPMGTERRAVPRPVHAQVPEAFEVPDSLQGLIAARIDALPVPDRRVLLSAAVLGRSFRPEALAAVAGLDPTTLRERLDALVRRELLTIDDELVSPARGAVAFVQDLVREVAYRTLARSERRTLHIASARYLESRSDEGAAEALASHLLEAHRLSPDHPDAPRIARRAVAAQRTAASDALRLHVPERALGHLEGALRMVDSSEQRAIVLEEAAGAARAAARLEVAEGHLRELIDLLGADGTPTDVARARARLASVLLMAQRNKSALTELESAVAAMGDPGRDPAGVEVASQLARARVLVGDDRGSLEWAERALEGARALGLDAVAGDALVTKGTARVRLGDAGGLDDLRTAIADAEAAGALATELRARNNLAWLVVADDPRTTLETAREGLELATTMGVGDIAVQLAEVACTAAIDTGDWSWALVTVDGLVRGPIPDASRINLLAIAGIIGALSGRRSALRAFEAIQSPPPDTDPQVVSGIVHARAWLAFLDGDFAAAARLAADAATATFGAEHAHQLTLQARANLWLGDGAAAAAVLDALGGLELSGRATEATVTTLRAGLAALGGDTDPSAFKRAREAWLDLGLPVHHALCLLDGRRLLGDAAAGREDVAAAVAGLGAEGLRPLVRLADGGDESDAPEAPARKPRATPGGRRPSVRARRTRRT